MRLRRLRASAARALNWCTSLLGLNLRSADLVVIGPGDLYTSLIPSLLVDGITDAIACARNRVFVVNLMTKAGESDNFKASTFVERLVDHLAPATLDAAFVNTTLPNATLLQRYAREGASPVEADAEAIRAHGIEVIARPLASARHLVRHDPTAVAATLFEWLEGRPATIDRQPACEFRSLT